MTHLAPANWTGRDDHEEGLGPWRWHQAMRAWRGAEPDSSANGPIVLAGFACDAGVRRNHGRAGAAAGPAVLRAALANIPLHGALALRDAGDISQGETESDGGGDLEALQTEYATLIEQILRAGAHPIGLGGGHEIAWASWSGLIASLGPAPRGQRVGIVNFDAHFDLRAGEPATSGTPFRQIAEQCRLSGRKFDYFCAGVSRFANTRALFERADDLGVCYLLDEQLTETAAELARTALAAFLAPLDVVYLTFCLDVLPGSAAPGVSAPAARGVALDVLEPLVDQVLASERVRVADIAEFNPRYDVDARTARVAARLVARIAQSMAMPC